MCGAYIPPANTTANITTKTDYFGNLEKSILKYKNKGNIIIMGDLNARIGNKDNTLNKKLNEDLGPYSLQQRNYVTLKIDLLVITQLILQGEN